MLLYTANELKNILKANLVGNENYYITSVSIDSRLVTASEGTLFFAIIGDQHDGHRFIPELYNTKNVRAFVVSNLNDFSTQFPGATFLEVENVLLAMQDLAAYHRSKFTYPVIGITGSNGKTIVKEWLSQLLAPEMKIVRSPKSFNSQVGVPLSLLQMDDKFNLGIFEAGISLPNEMERLERLIAPEIGIFTHLGDAHQENFIDRESKGIEKLKLFNNSKVLIYCKDETGIDTLIQNKFSKTSIQFFCWSRNQGADVWIKHSKVKGKSTTIVSIYQNNTIEFSIPFIDAASIENAMHCLCTLLYLKSDLTTIPQRMEQLLPVAMRLELKEGINGCTLINDSYNSDLGSLAVALDFLAQQGQHSKRMLILSDILQSGREPDDLYSQVAKLVVDNSVDQFIGIGKEIDKYSRFFSIKSQYFVDTQSFLNGFERNTLANTAILLKGSRQFQFERISQVLEQKTHRTLLEINLNALVNNLNYFRSLLKPHVKVMAMVKAFSYGSGSFEIANLLQFHRVDYLGVAFADEGVALREAGINLPIVVLNPAFGSYELMIDYNLEPEIFSFSSLESFALTARKKGCESYPAHIKIDTGMHRLGFMENEIQTLCERLTKITSVKVQGILSHLVATDDPNHDNFTDNQIALFERICNDIISHIGYKPTLHILNSAGIERFPNAQFDMVRLGIGLYGVSSVNHSKLQNVSTLKTFVAQIRKLEKNETVGYNRVGHLSRVSTIATIPIGYADGLNRRLSNGLGKVLINNQLAPIIGNISMDTCMIDITDIQSVDEGDEVVIFGENPSINDIAKIQGTIPYEVLTSVSRRVKRVYIKD
jgi:alanine racemase